MCKGYVQGLKAFLNPWAVGPDVNMVQRNAPRARFGAHTPRRSCRGRHAARQCECWCVAGAGMLPCPPGSKGMASTLVLLITSLLSVHVIQATAKQRRRELGVWVLESVVWDRILGQCCLAVGSRRARFLTALQCSRLWNGVDASTRDCSEDGWDTCTTFPRMESSI